MAEIIDVGADGAPKIGSLTRQLSEPGHGFCDHPGR